MKRLIIYFLSALLAFTTTTGMFTLKYHVMKKEKKLYQLHKEITQNNKSIHVLKAEWTNLSDMKRLRLLIQDNTSLQTVQASQIISWDNIADKEKETK